jgi:hypothetical protein
MSINLSARYEPFRIPYGTMASRIEYPETPNTDTVNALDNWIQLVHLVTILGNTKVDILQIFTDILGFASDDQTGLVNATASLDPRLDILQGIAGRMRFLLINFNGK